MIRVVVTLLISILLISLLRVIIGVVMKGVAELFQPSNPSTSGPKPPTVAGGELKRDPVCGTYVSMDASVRKTVKGQEVFFCSPACRDKYKA
jgi:YHS domain-containing protein